MYPIKTIPAFKRYLWGGLRLSTEFKKSIVAKTYAESWEISDHPEGPSVVDNGRFAGWDFTTLFELYPEMLGTLCTGDHLPVLSKWVDAQNTQSLQVHPSDNFAFEIERTMGKNSLLYVADAQPNSHLLLGLNDNITSEQLRQKAFDKTILDIVNKVPVTKGEFYLIPAGLVHAIGAGTLLVEVEECSNISYRIYDFDRLDENGKPRPLQIEKALAVIDPSLKSIRIQDKKPIQENGFTVRHIVAWQWFTTDLIHIRQAAVLMRDAESFSAFTYIEGLLMIKYNSEKILINVGESVFIPANIGEYSIIGEGKLLHTYMTKKI